MMSSTNSENKSPTKDTAEKNPFCTPKPIRHKRVNAIIGDVFKSPSLKIPASPFMERLGYGTGVGVYAMERSPSKCGEIRSPWAIKKVAKIMATKKLYAERLDYEANILRQLSHPNIIGYRAFTKSINGGSCLAMEKASTSLADLIEARLAECLLDMFMNPFPVDSINKVALDVSTALDYLHVQKRMIHGDLKSANVLIFGDFEVVKLCDFGVARKLKLDGTLDGNYVGTEIWNPMEVVLKQRGQNGAPITHKADIYPFGLTIFEMIALRPPHLSTAEDDNLTADADDDNEDDSFDEAAYEEALAQCVGTRPLLPDSEFNENYNSIFALFYCCTEEDPTKRPDAKDIVTLLSSTNNSLA